MIHSHNSQASKQEHDASSFFAISNILYGLNFGILGALINTFLHLSFLAHITLFFGQVLVLICLATRGLNAALVAVFISAIPAAIYANDAYLLIVFILEVLIVHVLLMRGFFLFQSATLYWLVVGIPLVFTLHALTSFQSPELSFVNGIARGIDGLLCLSLASLVCWLLPRTLLHAPYSLKPPRLASLIFSLCMITVTLPCMATAVFFTWQTTTSNEEIVAKRLAETAQQASLINNMEIERHLNSLITVASVVQTSATSQLQPLIAATAKHHPMFNSIMITDKFGRISNIAPSSYVSGLNKMRLPTLIEKEYFKEAKKWQNPLVSDAMVGQGLDTQYCLSLVAPYAEDGYFAGIVQGSILLRSLNEMNRQKINADYLFVITDSKGRIISHSEQLHYPLLSNFDYTSVYNPLIQNLPVLAFNDQQYIYRQSLTENNWKITILSSPKEITSVLVNFMFLLIVATFFLLAAFAFIANALAHKITKPLVDIAENFPLQEWSGTKLNETLVSSELLALTERLIDSHRVMSNFQEELSEQVSLKTSQLKQLNQELYSLAQKDSLTQLLNRAGFNRLASQAFRNCLRNSINMSLILIDIDHFKAINDNYGHPFGDKCIEAVAKVIQHHCKRDTDIIGRYGGEEFIVMISGGDIQEHIERPDMVRTFVQSLSFKHKKSLVKMTISAGVCSLSNDFVTNYEDVLQQADEQLYKSKREGRNRISSIIN